MTGEKIRKLLEKVVDWVYPPHCVNCGEPGALICENCLSQLQPVGEHFCPTCGKPLKPRHFCRHCSGAEFPFQSSRAPYLYEGPAKAMIKALKYKGTLALVPIMAKKLSDFWMTNLQWDTDLTVPVPLARDRKAQRGFNQSDLIAKAFCRNTGLKYDPRALMKIRETLQQVGLNAEERRENLSGAFAAEPSLVREKRILLIDDVMTTGSTFAECSAALLEAGASTVMCLSVATTPVDRGKQKTLDS